MSDTAAATTETRPKRWYIVHAYSNFENKVADSIREQAKLRGLADHIDQVLVPKEKVTEARRGRKVETERKFFPGYVLVRMDLTDDVYHLIKNTPKVTGFLGTDKKPMPISDAEADRILHQVQEGIERPKPAVSFEVGEQVRVSGGPFASFNGTVEEVDEGRSRVKVAVSIFGRATPVELEFGQVEKLKFWRHHRAGAKRRDPVIPIMRARLRASGKRCRGKNGRRPWRAKCPSMTGATR